MNENWKGATSLVPEPETYQEPAPNGEHEKFVCAKCGGDQFRVYSVSGCYRTYVECIQCGICMPEEGEKGGSTIVHSG